jgi:mono/diheme cytochrome c family protein
MFGTRFRSLSPSAFAGTVVSLLLCTLTLAACGSSGSLSPGSTSTSRSSSGSTTGTSAGAVAEVSGKQIFVSSGCAGCHTLAAAGSHGNVGPNLDQLKPSYSEVVTQVTNGGGGMPSFKGQLSTAKIDAVAHYVASVS